MRDSWIRKVCGRKVRGKMVSKICAYISLRILQPRSHSQATHAFPPRLRLQTRTGGIKRWPIQPFITIVSPHLIPVLSNHPSVYRHAHFRILNYASHPAKNSNYDPISTNTVHSSLDQGDSSDSSDPSDTALDLDANDDEFVVRDEEIDWEEGQLGDQEAAAPEEVELPGRCPLPFFF